MPVQGREREEQQPVDSRLPGRTGEKQKLRVLLRQRGKGIPADVWRKAGGDLGKRLAGLAEYRNASTVFAFASTEREPNLWPFLRGVLQDGKRLALPVCGEKGNMVFHLTEDLAMLSPGKYSILEPPSANEVVSPGKGDFLVVPCVACDREGNRLGHGGGFYDRYLEKTLSYAAVVCLESMLLETVPRDEWDIPIPLVVTEKTLYRQGRESAF